MNLLTETIEHLALNGKTASDVIRVSYLGTDQHYDCNWEDFIAIADFDYDNGYGSVEISLSLKIIGNDWWLEREEYDSAEEWAFKRMPAVAKYRPITKQDIACFDTTGEIK